MSQYNFYQNRAPVNINQELERPKCRDPEEVKRRVLEQYDLFMQMNDSDSIFKKLKHDKVSVSNQFLSVYKQLNKKDANLSTESVKQLNEMLNQSDDIYKEANCRYEEYLSSKLGWLKSNYPDIYTRLIDEETSLDRETLEHVLDAFCQSETKTIDRRKAVLSGLEHMRRKHNLPDDFFDTSKIDRFI